MAQRDHGGVRHHAGAYPPPLRRPVVDRRPPAGAPVRPVTSTWARPEPAHAQRERRGVVRTLTLGLATTLVVFALAAALVTVLEVVVDHPLSGGAPGATTLGELIHPRLAHTTGH